MAQTFGPQILNMIVKQDEVARYMAEKLGLQKKLIRDPQEQQALVNELQNMAQQGNMLRKCHETSRNKHNKEVATDDDRTFASVFNGSKGKAAIEYLEKITNNSLQIQTLVVMCYGI